jgi:hypothetical protein
MAKTVFSKVTRVGRATVSAVGLAVILALVLGVASAAFGANGGNFILGQGNVAAAITTLGGKLGADGPMLRVINNNEGANDTALDLRVQSGEAPMRVNSDARVTNLNADRLDGQEGSAFLAVGGKAADSDLLDGQDSTVFQVRGNFNECSGPFGGGLGEAPILFADCTTTVVAPANGKMLITGSGQYRRTGNPCQSSFRGFRGRIIVPNTGGFGGRGPLQSDVAELHTYGYAMTSGRAVPAGAHQVTFRLELDSGRNQCSVDGSNFPTYESLAVSATFVPGSGE